MGFYLIYVYFGRNLFTNSTEYSSKKIINLKLNCTWVIKNLQTSVKDLPFIYLSKVTVQCSTHCKNLKFLPPKNPIKISKSPKAFQIESKTSLMCFPAIFKSSPNAWSYLHRLIMINYSNDMMKLPEQFFF